jgi:hypothetical protein
MTQMKSMIRTAKGDWKTQALFWSMLVCGMLIVCSMVLVTRMI